LLCFLFLFCSITMGEELSTDSSRPKRPSQPYDPNAVQHTGHIDCHCLHHANESVEEAHTEGRIHLNGKCVWSCCGANWDDFACGPDKNHSAPERPGRKHTGHIECHCCHHTDETVEEAKTGGRYHLHGSCHWSCCGAEWDDFVCKNDSGDADSDADADADEHPTSTPSGESHHHTGFIACKCSHKIKEVWPANNGVFHGSECFWSCCGRPWSDKSSCPGGRPAIDLSEHRHSGFIKCGCCHHKQDTPESLRSSGRVHLNVKCFWSCCGARWDDPICESDLPESLKTRPPEEDDSLDGLFGGGRHRRHHRKPPESTEGKKKKKKKAGDFNKSNNVDFDFGKSKYDIDY